MATYRVFIGGWDDENPDCPDWISLDVNCPRWEAATELLMARLEGFRNDDCDQCRTDAIEGIEKLKTMPPGPFSVSVDGDDYMIFVNG